MTTIFDDQELSLVLKHLNISDSELGALKGPSLQILDVITEIYAYEKEQKLGQSHALTQAEKFRYLRAWPVEEETGRVLYTLAKYLKPQRILECGTSFGVSTIFFASALKENNRGTIITVEVSKLKHEAALKNFQRAGVENFIQQEKLAFDQYLKKAEGSFEIVFLDCDRSRYAFYLPLLLPHLKVGSFIIVDNALDRAKDIASYKETIEKDERFTTALVPIGDGLLISKYLAI